MAPGRYRIKMDTIAFEDGGHVACIVPKDALVAINNEASVDGRLVSVTWMHRRVKMFAQDLQRRAEKVEERYNE